MRQLSPMLEESTIEHTLVYSLKRPWRAALSTRLTAKGAEEWSLKATKLVSFVFPHEQIWELK